MRWRISVRTLSSCSATSVAARWPRRWRARRNRDISRRQTKGQSGDAVHNAVRAQALDVARQLENARPILREAAQGGRLKIVAALYDLDSGKVSVLPEAP